MRFLLSIHYLVWLVISSVFFAWGEYFSKRFGLTPSVHLVLMIFLVNAFCTLTWLVAIVQRNELGVVGVIWSVLSMLVTVLVGVIVFGERPSIVGIAGIIMAMIAVVLLSIG